MDNPGDNEVKQEMQKIIGEYSELAYAGKIRGLAFVIVDNDGDLRTRIAYIWGNKLPLLAGTTVLQRDMIEELQQRSAKNIDDDF